MDFEREVQRSRRDGAPEAIHDLRVAGRRALYAIDCFLTVVEGRDTARPRRRIKAVLAAGRAVRDRDIALDIAREAGLRPAAALPRTLRGQREDAREALARVLERRRYREFAVRWIARLDQAQGRSAASPGPMGDIVRSPSWDPAASRSTNARCVLPSLASRYLAQFRDACAARPTAEQLHRLRLAGKRLRYYLELFRSDAAPGGVAAVVTGLKAIQDELGRISDLDATEDLILSQVSGDDEDRARLLRFVRERRRGLVDSFLESTATEYTRPAVVDRWRASLADAPIA